jgi:hypothetical protein
MRVQQCPRWLTAIAVPRLGSRCKGLYWLEFFEMRGGWEGLTGARLPRI